MAKYILPKGTTESRTNAVLVPAEIMFDLGMKRFFGGDGVTRGGQQLVFKTDLDAAISDIVISGGGGYAVSAGFATSAGVALTVDANERNAIISSAVASAGGGGGGGTGDYASSAGTADTATTVADPERTAIITSAATVTSGAIVSAGFITSDAVSSMIASAIADYASSASTAPTVPKSDLDEGYDYDLI